MIEIDLTPELLKLLPSPDAQGLVRVDAAIKVAADGKTATLASVQGVPVGESEEAESDEPPADDGSPDVSGMPSPGQLESQIYGGAQ